MFDIGLGEIIVLAALALLVFGPDHLPKAAAQAGRFVRDLRSMAASARKELSDSADLDGISNDLKSIADLHPKRILSSVWEDPSPDAAPTKASPGAPAKAPGNAGGPTASGAASTPPVEPRPQASDSQSYDPDAT